MEKRNLKLFKKFGRHTLMFLVSICFFFRDFSGGDNFRTLTAAQYEGANVGEYFFYLYLSFAFLDEI